MPLKRWELTAIWLVTDETYILVTDETYLGIKKLNEDICWLIKKFLQHFFNE